MSAQIGYAVVLADQLDKTRSLSFQLNFVQGASAAEMNTELDKLVAVLDRQRAKASIYEAEQFLKAQRNILQGIEEDLAVGETRIATAQPDPTRRNSDPKVKQLADALEQQKRMVHDVRGKIKAAEEELEILRNKAA